MRLQWGAATDVGRLRHDNQDSYLTNDRVLAVADGMGGHRGGQVASQTAIETLGITYAEPSVDALQEAAEVANQAVLQRAASDPELRGMGTTLVAIAPVDTDGERQSVGWVNIGDSRLYLFRDGELEQLSEDHSLVEEMVRDGRLSPDDARSHPQRNILTRALGIDPEPNVDRGTVDPYAGDRFLLCSDGLFNEVDEARIAATLRRLADPDEAAKELVRLALEGGGRDNITVVVADVVDDDDAAAVASEALAGEGTAEGHALVPPAGPAADGAASASATVEDSDESRPRHRKARPRLLTLRLVLFVVVLLAVVGGALFAVLHQARSGYTVKLVDGSVIVYEGNGDDVLWFKAKVVDDKGQLPLLDEFKNRLVGGQHFDDRRAVDDFLTRATTPSTTTTTTTSTTTTSTTSTTTTVLTPN